MTQTVNEKDKILKNFNIMLLGVLSLQQSAVNLYQ